MLTRKLENHQTMYGKLQERFRQLQDNIDTITEGPLRDAEAQARHERARLQGTISRLEAEVSKLKLDVHDKTKTNKKLLAVIKEKEERERVDPSSAAAAAARIQEITEQAAEAGASAYRAQRNLATAERCGGGSGRPFTCPCLSFCHSVILSFCHSVILSFCLCLCVCTRLSLSLCPCLFVCAGHPL